MEGPTERTPAPSMDVQIMNCDRVHTHVDGKLYVWGGGWDVRRPEPMETGLAVQISVPYDLMDIEHTFELELLDLEHNPVWFVEEPDGSRNPLKFVATFQANKIGGLKPGTPRNVAMGIPVPALPLPESTWLVWVLRVNGQQDEWRQGFSTTPATADAT